MQQARKRERERKCPPLYIYINSNTHTTTTHNTHTTTHTHTHNTQHTHTHNTAQQQQQQQQATTNNSTNTQHTTHNNTHTPQQQTTHQTATTTTTNADFIFGGETQLWPEIHAYFGRTDEIAWKEKMSDTLGKISGWTTGEAHRRTPERLGQRRLFHGEKNVMLKYIEETEQRWRDTRARSRRVGDDLSPSGCDR